MDLARLQNPTHNKRQSACRIRQNWRRKTIALGSGASQFETSDDTQDDTRRMVHSTAAILDAPFAATPDGSVGGSASPSSMNPGEVPEEDEGGLRTPSVVWKPRETGSVQSRVWNFEALLRRSNSCDGRIAKIAHSAPPSPSTTTTTTTTPYRQVSNGNHAEKSLFKEIVQRRVQQDEIATADGPLKPIVSNTMPPKIGHLHRSWVGDPGGKYHHRRSVPAAFAMALDDPPQPPSVPSVDTVPWWTSANKVNNNNDYPAPDSVSRKKQVFEELMQSQTPPSRFTLRKSRSDAGVHVLKSPPKVVDDDHLTPMEAPKSKVMLRKACFVAHPVLNARLSLDNQPEPEVTVKSISSTVSGEIKPNIKIFQRGSLQRSSLERFRQMSEKFTLTDVNRRFPFVTKETTFEVTLTKSSRGLGIGICGGYDNDTADCASERDPLDALVRVKRLFPLQPALLSGKMQPGDVLLAVNGRPLTGLANYEAIDAIRVAPSEVTLTVCRPPTGTLPPVPQAGNLPSSSFLSLSSISLTGQQPDEAFHPPASPREFQLRLVKVKSSLGFTIHQRDGIPGHFVKALVRDPALTDGRLQPGDLVVKVNGTDISGFSHSEAIDFLRNTPKEVDLLVKRGVETPLTPLSPVNHARTFPKVETKRKMLRKEARDLLSDKIGKKNGTESGSSRRKPFGSSPRARRKRFEEETSLYPEEKEVQESDKTRVESNYTADDDEWRPKKMNIADEPINPTSSSPLKSATSQVVPQRPSSLDLNLPEFPTLSRRQNGPSVSPIPCLCVTRWNSGDRSSDTESSTANTEVDFKTADNQEFENRDLMSSSTDELYVTPPQSPLVSNELNPDLNAAVIHEASCKLMKQRLNDEQHQVQRHIFTVDLQRTIGSRLGFSLTTTPTTCLNPDICIKAVFPGTLADADGRIKVGDALLQVNDTDLSGLSIEDTIKILRDIKGTVSLILAREVSRI